MDLKVSILCITYNQAEYIQETLDSFLAQVTDFPYEILIHDDCSTDGTTAIVKRYAKRYPDKIRLFLEKENQYSKHNFEFIKDMFVNAQGTYIATCEGDDYWTDVHKLQKQVEFLDAHDDYALCFHASEVRSEGGDRKPYVYPDVKDEHWYTHEELFRINYIPTASVMYRKQNYSSFISDMMPGDWYTHLYHAQFGKIKFIDEKMAVYRKHEGGVFYDFDHERDQIWIRHGLDYTNFYSELKNIYRSNPKYIKIISELLFAHMNTLTGVDDRHGTHILSEVSEAYREEMLPFVTYQYNQIERLKVENEKLRVELLEAGDRRYEYEVIADLKTRQYEELKREYENAKKIMDRARKTLLWRMGKRAVKLKNHAKRSK